MPNLKFNLLSFHKNCNPQMFTKSKKYLCAFLLYTLLLSILNAQESINTNTSDYSVASTDVNTDQILKKPIEFSDLGIIDVLQILEEFTEKSILRQNNLPQANLTYKSKPGDTVGETILALESLLSLNGVVITPIGDNLLKAIPSKGVEKQSPTLIEGSTLQLPPSQQVYSKFFKLQFLSTEEAKGFISKLLNGDALITEKKSSTLFITDSLINLQRIEVILKKVDHSSSNSMQIIVYEPDFVSAENLASELKNLSEGGLRYYLAKEPTFESDKRTNQLIVFTEKSNEKVIRNLINKLDKDVAPLTQTEIYHIKHSTAKEISGLIEKIITNQEKTSEDEDQQVKTNTEEKKTSPKAKLSNEGSESLQFSKYISLVPDDRANTILATGTTSDQKYLKALIEKMDVFLPQVRIEVLIAEVNLTEKEASGIQKLNLLYKKTAASELIGDESSIKNIDDAYGLISDTINYGSGIALGPLAEHPLDAFQLVLDTAKSNGDVSVLSAPTVVTTHNREAKIVISTKRPIITSTNSYTDTSNVSASVQYTDIGLELKVTPLIGSNDIIQLDIDQKYENVVGTILINKNDQPIIGSRRTSSYVSVADGQLVILGGLQSVDENNTKNKMAILGDIPILGKRLFTYKSNEKQRTELLILVRPKILKNPEEAHKDASDSIENFHNKESILNYKNKDTFFPQKESIKSKKNKKNFRRKGKH